MNEIDKELGKRLLYFDGGMGTLLQGMGLSGGERPETWNLRSTKVICGKRWIANSPKPSAHGFRWHWKNLRLRWIRSN